MLGKLSGVVIEAVGAVVSKNRVSVEARCKNLLSAKKASRLAKGTGIHKLSIAVPEVCTSDLCYQAAEKIFASGWDRNDIGALIFITQTADYLTPATSYYLQERLHLPKDIIAYDVNLGCSGFVYGIFQAASMLTFLGGRKVLLMVGDTSSRNAFPQDTGLLSIAGDAGAAAIIGSNETSEIVFHIESFGERADMLLVKRGGYRALRLTEGERLTDNIENYCNMDGLGVMAFSLEDVPKNIEQLFEYASIGIEEIELALVHQANSMIVSSLADKLGIQREKMPFRSENIGNTSSASIPVLMSEMQRRGEFKPFRKVLLSGFGVGMSVASAIVDLSHTKVLETGEL
ncbi:3-oxoacyl-[acyl-carrier-protein] synthase III C-terminal domain-containing protein [Selenomonas ruminantium]|uniref:3-oxoacyl-[acyl-carrier-protein] synthase-3 n=1 Tax=Selenomonas ruminantium TaxID=971 RepID=A0A1H0S2P6_SELRU|nr:3-oxoacyl-[acyl-carrier-protein] synthase III C-terminal domain-containing protein [Selenomonas ruminantium]SDP35536.1 3-oxoacyl-[acyl-carrier-protein] synthase-3 [Selenomonas ruminantium]